MSYTPFFVLMPLQLMGERTADGKKRLPHLCDSREPSGDKAPPWKRESKPQSKWEPIRRQQMQDSTQRQVPGCISLLPAAVSGSRGEQLTHSDRIVPDSHRIPFSSAGAATPVYISIEFGGIISQQKKNVNSCGNKRAKIMHSVHRTLSATARGYVLLIK